MKKAPRKSRPARAASAPPKPDAPVDTAFSSVSEPDPAAENQRALSAALSRVRAFLQAHANAPSSSASSSADASLRPASFDIRHSAGPALSALCAGFKLSPFERDLLLLCAGPELDASFPSIIASASGDPLERPLPRLAASSLAPRRTRPFPRLRSARLHAPPHRRARAPFSLRRRCPRASPPRPS